MQSAHATKSNLHTVQTTMFYVKAMAPYKAAMVLSSALPLSNILLGVAVPFLASKILAGIVSHGSTVWQDFYWFVGSIALGAVLNVVGIRNCVTLQAKVMEDL